MDEAARESEVAAAGSGGPAPGRRGRLPIRGGLAALGPSIWGFASEPRRGEEISPLRPLPIMTLTGFPGSVHGEDRVVRDITYPETGGELNRVDVFAPAGGVGLPLEFLGGLGPRWSLAGRRQANGPIEATAINEHGVVMVSVDHRPHPASTYTE